MENAEHEELPFERVVEDLRTGAQRPPQPARPGRADPAVVQQQPPGAARARGRAGPLPVPHRQGRSVPPHHAPGRRPRDHRRVQHRPVPARDGRAARRSLPDRCSRASRETPTSGSASCRSCPPPSASACWSTGTAPSLAFPEDGCWSIELERQAVQKPDAAGRRVRRRRAYLADLPGAERARQPARAPPARAGRRPRRHRRHVPRAPRSI